VSDAFGDYATRACFLSETVVFGDQESGLGLTS
jgi:hypothetical protein